VSLENIVNTFDSHFIVGSETAYPVGNLKISSAFDGDSQALAGGLFNVATRVSSMRLLYSISIHKHLFHPYLAGYFYRPGCHI
jgi:hypothetical protein